MPLTLDQLRMIAPHAPEAAVAPLDAAMTAGGIDTPLRRAGFLAQVAHESNQFRQLIEDGDGSHYEGRRDLGNIHPGDGPRFKGRGYLQTTGRANYSRVAAALGIDCVTHPELLEQPEHAARSAVLYWMDHGINRLADDGDVVGMTRAVNGGLNGLNEREAFYTRALPALGAVPACGEPSAAGGA